MCRPPCGEQAHPAAAAHTQNSASLAGPPSPSFRPTRAHLNYTCWQRDSLGTFVGLDPLWSLPEPHGPISHRIQSTVGSGLLRPISHPNESSQRACVCVWPRSARARSRRRTSQSRFRGASPVCVLPATRTTTPISAQRALSPPKRKSRKIHQTEKTRSETTVHVPSREVLYIVNETGSLEAGPNHEPGEGRTANPPQEALAGRRPIA